MSYCTAGLSAVKNEKKGSIEGAVEMKNAAPYWGPSGQINIDEMKSVWGGNELKIIIKRKSAWCTMKSMQQIVNANCGLAADTTYP